MLVATEDRSRTGPFAAVDAELLAIVAGIGLLGAATPREAHVERARLLRDWKRGEERLPSWTYDRAPRTEILKALCALDHRLDAGEFAPRVPRRLGHEQEGLAHLYRERIAELCKEAVAAESVGTPAFAAHARARFEEDVTCVEALQMAREWLKAPRAVDESPRLLSDELDSRSLVSRLRAEVTRRRLPFAVRTSPSLSALAAVSGDTIWVAEGRALSTEDVERTVMHEIMAHALPRTRARSLSLGLFTVGTARGSDDQEGYALWLEDKRGFATPARRAELAARHVAVCLMDDGADFVAVVRALSGDYGLSLELALRAAERAFRGSLGQSPGLGRERVYLCALLRVRQRLTAFPGDETVLRSGQVAVDAIDTLRAHCH